MAPSRATGTRPRCSRRCTLSILAARHHRVGDGVPEPPSCQERARPRVPGPQSASSAARLGRLFARGKSAPDRLLSPRSPRSGACCFPSAYPSTSCRPPPPTKQPGVRHEILKGQFDSREIRHPPCFTLLESARCYRPDFCLGHGLAAVFPGHARLRDALGECVLAQAGAGEVTNAQLAALAQRLVTSNLSSSSELKPADRARLVLLLCRHSALLGPPEVETALARPGCRHRPCIWLSVWR
jgi:hypothetical protein